MQVAPPSPPEDIPQAKDLHAIVRALDLIVQRVHRRTLWARGLRTTAHVLPWSLLPLGFVVMTIRIGWMAGWILIPLLAGGLLALILRGVRSARELSPLHAALLIDRHLGGDGRFASAYEFSRGNVGSGYQQLAVREAKDLLPRLEGPVVELVLPREILWAGGLAVALTAVAFVPSASSRPERQQPAASAPLARSSTLSVDDAELLKRGSEALKTQLKSEQGRQLVAEYNELLLRLRDGTLSQSEGFRMAADLAAKAEAQGKQAEELAQGLVRRGELLLDKRVTSATGKALSERRFVDAKEALEKLAERLSKGSAGLSASELEDLRGSLEQLRKEQEQEAQRDAQEHEATERTRAELERRQAELESKRAQGQASPRELAELAQTERELKRLHREKRQQAGSAQEQLSELDRKLAEALRALQREREKSAEFLEQAARQVGEQAGRRLTDQEKQALLEQLEALKERLREQNQDGGREQRMRDFQRRARGQPPQPGAGEAGQPEPGQAEQVQVTFGPNGTRIPSDDSTQAASSAEDGQETRASGSEAGHAHDPSTLEGAPNRLGNEGYVDQAAAGQDSGAGPSASETIVTAAERGFVSGNYQKLYQQYETVAEEVMDRDRVPSGRRTHVRRYFELIRPRRSTPTNTP